MFSNAGAGISGAPDLLTLPGSSIDIGRTGQRVLHLAGRGNLYINSPKEVQEVSSIECIDRDNCTVRSR